MKHLLTRAILGCEQCIELTPEEYRAIIAAKDRLITILGVEEKLDFVVENLPPIVERLRAF